MDFAKIDDLKIKLQSKRPLTSAELKRVRDEFIIHATYDSNAIEGNSLTLRETALILKEGVTIGEKPLKDHLEAIGHRDAFEYVLTLADAKTPLTERVIKDIHSLVLVSDPVHKGVYRNIPVMIVGAEYTPPQPHLVSGQMEQLLADYEGMKKDYHTIEAIAEFHLRFEGIHPFVDGNGRTGRLILNLELLKSGLLPINIKFSDRRKYYDCFDAYYADGHDSNMLANLIADYEQEELERYIQMLDR